MAASNFNLRGISSEVMTLLKQEAKKSHVSVNTFVLKMVEKGLGFTQKKFIHHDLDHLAGTWSTEDEKNFKENTQFFEEIDKEMWE